MPIHDWSRVPDGIFHHFHHDWITEIARTLNRTLLPREYYALAEQVTGSYSPAVLTRQRADSNTEDHPTPLALSNNGDGGAAVALEMPRTEIVVEAELQPFHRRQNTIVIRHVSDDSVVAMVEIVSPGNKASRHAFQQFVDKAVRLMRMGIHLLIVDLHPRTRRDPLGFHPPIWDELVDQEMELPADRPLAAVAYEVDAQVRAHIQPLAVGNQLPDMPLYLAPGFAVRVPLEATYQAAFAPFPERWRSVLMQP